MEVSFGKARIWESGVQGDLAWWDLVAKPPEAQI